MSGVLLKASFSSARKAYYWICLINGPHNWNNRTVEKMVEDTNCNSSVCK